MLEVTKLFATLCCGVFFGAALYISPVQHPAALETGNDFAARFFSPHVSAPRCAASEFRCNRMFRCDRRLARWAGKLWLVAAVLSSAA